MNIIVNEINNNNNSYFKNLPLTNQRKSSLNPFKHPKILKPRKLTPRTSTNLHNYSVKEFKRHDMKQEKIMQTTIPVIGNTSHGNIGKRELKIKINTFKLIWCKLRYFYNVIEVEIQMYNVLPFVLQKIHLEGSWLTI